MDEVSAPDAPAPVGPYAQAIRHGGFIFLSGQIPINPETGALQGDSIEEQAERALSNLEAVLRAADAGWSNVLRVTVYMTELSEFARFNAVYERVLDGAKPARATVEVAALPKGARLEIDAIAASRAR